MTSRDKSTVEDLYYIHRFLPSSIAKLYGVSHVTVLNILKKKDISIIPDIECLICGLKDSETFYIDGNENNKTPQNIITLCEADKRRLRHMQIRRHQGVVTPQF